MFWWTRCSDHGLTGRPCGLPSAGPAARVGCLLMAATGVTSAGSSAKWSVQTLPSHQRSLPDPPVSGYQPAGVSALVTDGSLAESESLSALARGAFALP